MKIRKIVLLFFVIVVLGNTFTTNFQALNSYREQCSVNVRLYENPCVIVTIEGQALVMEQEIDAAVHNIEMPYLDFIFVALNEQAINPQDSEFLNYYARDLSPPTYKQLPRSHITIS